MNENNKANITNLIFLLVLAIILIKYIKDTKNYAKGFAIPFIFITIGVILNLINLIDPVGIEQSTNGLFIFIASFVLCFTMIYIVMHHFKIIKQNNQVFLLYLLFFLSLLTIIFSAQAI